jgi:crossover junction endodeoxyribonuclease RusA
MSDREWVLTLPFTKPLNMNDRMNWRERSRYTRSFRDAALVLARKERIPSLAHFTAVLHSAPRTVRTRDPENLTATVKPLVDGLILAGVAAGDDPRYYTPTTPVIHDATGEPGRLWLVVRELPAPEPEGATP